MKLQMLSSPNLYSPYRTSSLHPVCSPSCNNKLTIPNIAPFSHSSPVFSFSASREIKLRSAIMSSSSALSDRNEVAELALEDSELDTFALVANKLADSAGEIIRKYFRKSFDIFDKEDLSEKIFDQELIFVPMVIGPVTIADQAAEEAMVKIIQDNFPSHAVYGEENGWTCKENVADFVWVLDPIDGTKSFITGKPLFGTLIALLHKGEPVLGIIDQPILKERWVGLSGRKTTLNGQETSTRSCAELSKAYLYTTSPHLFRGDAEMAFARVREKVKVPLYGCDCYAYALLATGFVDLVIESGLKPYDFLSLIPVIEGAGGIITDWKGHNLNWKASAESQAASFNVVAAGDKHLHSLAVGALQWS